MPANGPVIRAHSSTPRITAWASTSSLGRPSELVLAQAVILGVLLCALMTGPFAGIAALSFAALVLAGLETLARRQIGGYTGDVLGAAQQVTETAILVAL